ncbi:hypothetical protein DL96DRAFT_1613241 [Flagelloscypha sp. PMI_526]|nr:hypothetical protein DL96DRAFT_1613241 [Flagelloscypha sp. PMI_526]
MLSLEISSSSLLPPDVLEKVVIFSVDSSSHTVSLKLCTISRLFYESAIKRLYHTISIYKIEKLEQILQASAVQKPWVAACVRVLMINCADGIPQVLVTQALMAFPGLLSLWIPSSTVIDPACPLPYLSRLVQMDNGPIPSHIAQHITHLYLFGVPSTLVALLVRHKDAYKSLTHFLVVNGTNSGLDGLSSVLDILEPIVPHGLPETLKIFMIFSGVNYEKLSGPLHKELLDQAQNILEVDPRIVLWKQGSQEPPDAWTRPWLFEYGTHGNLVDQCLGAQPDGVVGLWEAVDLWVGAGGQAGRFPRKLQ